GGDVRQEIGVAAVRLAQHAILVVSERGGPEPQGAVPLVGVAPLSQIGQGLFDEPFLVELGLEEDHVEPDSELPQVLLLFGALRLDADRAAAAGLPPRGGRRTPGPRAPESPRPPRRDT